MSDKTTYYQRNREKAITLSKRIIKLQDCENKQKINIENSNEEKDIKREYGRNRYQNMFE